VLPLRISSVNIMGVRVPTIEQTRISRSAHDRGYSVIGASTTLDEAAAAFEAEVDMIIELAESELRLRRLISEIQRTSRRANALKNILIPRLATEARYIQMTLDERERSDHFRLKLAKRVLEHKREQVIQQQAHH
jgi:V/A-type H+-transporting ATPase subunit D